ncbi:MAG: hypothetical protein RR645_01320 [Clostridium sp.]
MGTLYREEVKCYDKGLFKKIIGLVMFTIVSLVICTISDIVQLGEYYEFVLVSVIVIGVVTIKALKSRMVRVYRYEIIDKEIIIEDVTKGRRIVKINFKTKNIVLLDEVGSEYTKGNISRKYNFICNHKCKNAKTCIYEKEGKIYSFKFEPSETLVSKIQALRAR